VSDRSTAHPTPAHVTLAAVLQVRDGALQALLWERAREPDKGLWSVPGGYLVQGGGVNLWLDAGPGTPDGLRVDVDGNLWVGWGMGEEGLDGVSIFNPEGKPIGQEYIVPLCKTGGGNFMILNLDPNKDCEEEVTNPSSVQFNDFPVDVDTDTGNDCAKKIEDAVAAADLHGTPVMIPICDGQCTTTNGTNATYHIIRMTSFYLDYISYSNNANNGQCSLTESPNYPGSTLVNIVGGNGSSSCIAGWFVRYVTSGPVGTGNITKGEAIGVQLIR